MALIGALLFIHPVINSVVKVLSRQWLSAVPGPPVFSTGTFDDPPIRFHSDPAAAPRNLGSELPDPDNRCRDPLAHEVSQSVPIPRTWPIS